MVEDINILTNILSYVFDKLMLKSLFFQFSLDGRAKAANFHEFIDDPFTSVVHKLEATFCL